MNNRTPLLAFISFVTGLLVSAQAEMVTLTLFNPGTSNATGSLQYDVPPNVAAQIISFGNSGPSVPTVTLTFPNLPTGYEYVNVRLSTNVPSPLVVGPATIKVSFSNNSFDNGAGIIFITIQTTAAATASFTPSSSIVIPNDNGGPVTIKLESSSDMVKWVEASPGTYGTTYSNRFFRIKAQR